MIVRATWGPSAYCNLPRNRHEREFSCQLQMHARSKHLRSHVGRRCRTSGARTASASTAQHGLLTGWPGPRDDGPRACQLRACIGLICIGLISGIANFALERPKWGDSDLRVEAGLNLATWSQDSRFKIQKARALVSLVSQPSESAQSFPLLLLLLPAMASAMTINIKTMQPATYSLSVAPNVRTRMVPEQQHRIVTKRRLLKSEFIVPMQMAVQELKVKLAETSGIRADLQRIIFRGRVLTDDQRLTDCGVPRPPPPPSRF